MFNPARTKPVMYGLLGFTLVALLVALALWRDYPDCVAGCLGFAACFRIDRIHDALLQDSLVVLGPALEGKIRRTA